MKTKRTWYTDVIYYGFVIAFGFIMVYPILWMVASSLKPASEIFSQASSLIPSEFVWSNYPDGWAGFGRTGFDIYFKNSFIITTSVVIGAILSSSIVAYGFARLQFKFKKVLFACLIATVMLPVQITLIPQYILFHNLGWVNTFYPLIVPAFLGGTPFFIFLLIQFIRGIPRELDEAAIIDGCSTFGVFWRVILPLLKPALVTVAIFAFMWTWDDFLAPLIYLNKTDIQTVALGLRNFMDAESGTSWGALLAMSTLSLLPQFIIFLFFQRYLVEGISTTGLK
ncbi:carbohydrate ABC transporter permease [Halalkalibacterium halodurans]|uniref:ABC transporter permease n=1 Tax=Halalkalibacterium halodurans TaxID=86665 RepID=A0A0M0KLX7_ALKHA|nr:carbohydrate ABC transporter permease [Halalkalibacterium halodurans]MED3645498.1 carbohydrate ABC transporter permease [Halalkalibacterium halodurans]MED4162310.1 carbohydrate ABC transporter permease [Halalkalibacterium halodurans]TES57943.1 carbohydrate ABC transporter permease [Halalkalibacterium halodurans]TPE70769.1 carbohydrate ABC transporter permease [Halalkalibacterium halodurans]